MVSDPDSVVYNTPSPHCKHEWPLVRPTQVLSHPGSVPVSEIRSSSELNPLGGDLKVSISFGGVIRKVKGSFAIGGSRDTLELLRRELDLVLASRTFSSGWISLGCDDETCSFSVPQPVFNWTEKGG